MCANKITDGNFSSPLIVQIKLPKIHKDISGQIERGKPVYEEVEKIKELITYKSKI